MKVYKISPQGYSDCNAYAVTENGTDCIVIDCPRPYVSDACKRLGLIPRYVLLTHGHYDHVCGCAALKSAGAKILCGKDEQKFIFSEGNLSIFGLPIPAFTVDGTFEDGEEAELCGLKIKVIATPGHTPGGVSYLVGDALFTGDTLFCGSIGRTDFPGGSFEILRSSIKKLYALAGDPTVYCGHDRETKLSKERATNPYVGG